MSQPALPRSAPRLTRSTVALWLSLLLALVVAAPVAAAADPGAVDLDADVTDGAARALAVAPDGTTYIGGQFSRVGRPNGAAVPVDKTTGDAATFGSFPVLRGGAASAVISDGEGGYYVAGQFEIGADATHLGVVRVRADGTKDPAFAAVRVIGRATPGGSVTSLALVGGKLYLGGLFASVNGQPRGGLAAVDPATGALDAWTWAATSDPIVRALAADGGTLYVGGQFALGDRANLAAIATATGAPTAWTARADRQVWALEVADGRLYVGGAFTQVDGEPRTRLAAFALDSGALTAWAPALAGTAPYDIARAGDRVYAAGRFTAGAGAAQRTNLAAFDADQGTLSAWNPGEPAGQVRALAVADGALYLGGDFTSLAGQERLRTAAVALDDGTLRSWQAPASGTVNALLMRDGDIVVAGDQSFVGGVARQNLAAIGPDGRVTGWNPSVTGSVAALALHGGQVFVGGTFSKIGGADRRNLAALDQTSGAVVADWAPDVDGAVAALLVAGDFVYAGGAFRKVGGQDHRGLVRVGVTSGAVDAWDPWIEQAVTSLAVSGGRLYAGGQFTHVGGNPGTPPWVPATGNPQPRPRLAAWTLGATPTLEAALPDVDGAVHALAAVGDRLYVGGQFGKLGAEARWRAGAIDTATNAVAAWDAGLTTQQVTAVRALAADAERVYVAGEGGAPFGAFAATDAAPRAWGGVLGGAGFGLALDPVRGLVHAAGDVSTAGRIFRGPNNVYEFAGIRQAGLARIGADDGTAPPPATAPLLVVPSSISRASAALPPTPGESLYAQEGYWGGTTPLTFSYRWERSADGQAWTAITGATARAYTVTEEDLGQRLRVEIVASNPAGSAPDTVGATAAVVPATPPTSSAPPVLTTSGSGTPVVGVNYVQASSGTWEGSQPITFSYRWERALEGTDTWTVIAGVTVNYYNYAAVDHRHRLRVTVTATNSAGTATSAPSAPTEVVRSRPVNTVAPQVTGSYGVGATLSMTSGEWEDQSSLTLRYEWRRYRNNALQVIDDATTAHYQLRPEDEGARVYPVVLASNPYGETQATTVTGSVTTLPVVQPAPVSTAAPVLSGTAAVGQELSVSDGAWTADPAPSFSYRWERGDGEGWEPIPGADASSYRLVAADQGRRVRAVVIATSAGVAERASDASDTVVSLGVSRQVAVGGTVAGALGLELDHGAVELGPFVPGVADVYDATLSGRVTATGPSVLTVVDEGPEAGYLVNNGAALDAPLSLRAGAGEYTPLSGTPRALTSFAASVSAEPVTIGLRQPISASEGLVSGRYGKTLTFTLAAGTP